MTVNPYASRKKAYYTLVILTIVYSFNFIDRQLLAILQEAIKADLGLSDSQLGLLTGFAFAAFYLIAGIPIARWADRSNRRDIVAISLFLWSFMTAVSGFVQNFLQLLLARIGVKYGHFAGRVLEDRAANVLRPADNSGRMCGWHRRIVMAAAAHPIERQFCLTKLPGPHDGPVRSMRRVTGTADAARFEIRHASPAHVVRTPGDARIVSVAAYAEVAISIHTHERPDPGRGVRRITVVRGVTRAAIHVAVLVHRECRLPTQFGYVDIAGGLHPETVAVKLPICPVAARIHDEAVVT